MGSKDFRDYLLPLDSPRVVNARGLDPFEYAKPILERQDAKFLINSWMALYSKPFKGITADGTIQQNLFDLADEGFDTASAVEAGEALLRDLSEEERKNIQYPINAHEWRSWYNPEFPMHSYGVRLDYASQRVRDAVTNLLKACLGPAGFIKIQNTRATNHLLGELYDLRNIMNEWSYHFLLFGKPSLVEPWGWSMFGHHLAVSCFILERQMVISPTFLGVEPNVVESGAGGTVLAFLEEESYGLDLIRSLSPEQREKAITFKLMVDPAMPKGRWHFADERHLGASYQDNRVIPYEGVSGQELSTSQRELVLKIIETFINYLPDGPRKARMAQIETRLDATYFSWIGGFGDDDPFYYRIQGPLIMVEFDHHSGVWLSNKDPEKFHIHTVVRTPNGNDYGKDLLRQHYERSGKELELLQEVDREPFKYEPLEESEWSAPMTRAEHDPRSNN